MRSLCGRGVTATGMVPVRGADQRKRAEAALLPGRRRAVEVREQERVQRVQFLVSSSVPVRDPLRKVRPRWYIGLSFEPRAAQESVPQRVDCFPVRAFAAHRILHEARKRFARTQL